MRFVHPLIDLRPKYILLLLSNLVYNMRIIMSVVRKSYYI